MHRSNLALTHLAILSCVAPFLSGCSANFQTLTPPTVLGATLGGQVHGGQQPVVGARIYLYAAGTAGLGSASRSLLTAPGYVLSDRNGRFSITGGYTCQPGDQVYVVAIGGNPGLAPGTNNAALALETGLGSCSALTSSTEIAVNEVTTVATVFAITAFESGLAQVGSNNTPASRLGLANAFAMIPNLVNIASGNSRSSVVNGASLVPVAEINTLANILSSCINTAGTGDPCDTLFSLTAPRLLPPTDTISSLVAVAGSPGNSVQDLFNLSTANAPFQPVLTSAPNDWSISLLFAGLGAFSASSIAIDSQGNAWLPRHTADNNGGLVELSPSGRQLSPAGGFKGGGINDSYGVAIDPNDNVWVSNNTEDDFALAASPSSGSLSKFTNAGVPLSPSTGFQNGSLLRPHALAVDGTGAVWAQEFYTGEIKLDSSGKFLSDTPAFSHGGRFSSFVSIDPSNNFWAPNLNSDSVAELSPLGSVIAFQYPTDTSNFGALPTAIDHNGNVWVGGSSLTKLANTGARLSPVGGYSGGGIGTSAGTGFPLDLAIDGVGTVFSVVSTNTTGRASFNNILLAAHAFNGYPLSPSTGFHSSFLFSPVGMAIDGSGNVWIADNGLGAIVFLGLATPVVTPLALAIKNGTLATIP